jgi:hypothetical protein
MHRHPVEELAFALPCALQNHYPLSVRVDASSTDVAMHGVVRTTSTSWDGCGGRTDLHDVLSATWAAVLRANGVASSRLVGVEGMCGPPELYARLLFF